MKLDPLNIGLILTTLITVLAGWASQRAAAKAARIAEKEKAENVRISAKETAELEAYSRARAMDLVTINRQNEEIGDLLEDNIKLRKREREHIDEIDKLRTERIALVKQNIQLKDQLRGVRHDHDQ